MVKALRHIPVVLALLLSLATIPANAQSTNAFARVSISPREGVVRQPYKVTIRVYSSTWFASPLQFTNLQIENAFIIPFTRTVSGIDYINNKKYASLTFYYLVFPYNTGKLEIPELVINASIPPEGEYKGQPVTIRTKAQTVKVYPIPVDKNEPIELVASNVTIQENWSRPLTDLKVGDVLERTITIRANNTLPSLIPPMELSRPGHVSIYADAPDLQDKRTSNGVNGVRVEKYSYLFEEEGEVLIPEEEVVWWNPTSKKPYRRALNEQTLQIAANPDLALLKSLKDSLQALAAPQTMEVENKKVPWIKLGILLVAAVLILYLLFRLTRKFVQRYKQKNAAYKQSEAYEFKQLQATLDRGNSAEVLRALYRWFDKARNFSQPAAIDSFLNNEEKAQMLALAAEAKGTGNLLNADQKHDYGMLFQVIRQKVLNADRKKQQATSLNPV